MSTTANMIAGVPLFALLDEHERSILAERVEIVRFSAGTSIFNFGDPGDAMYIVKSGDVELTVKTKTGEEITLERPGPAGRSNCGPSKSPGQRHVTRPRRLDRRGPRGAVP